METSSRTRNLGVAAAVVLALFAAWWALRPAPAPPEPASAVEVARAAEPAPPPVRPPVPETTTVDFLPDGQPIRPAGGPTEVDTTGMAPHGHTPQHLRIYRENNLIGDLNSAMDNRDVARLRQVLEQYRDEYPEDAHVLQVGYEIIAGCQERLTPERRAAAQRYYDEELDSGLRRYIRRYCLEG